MTAELREIFNAGEFSGLFNVPDHGQTSRAQAELDKREADREAARRHDLAEQYRRQGAPVGYTFCGFDPAGWPDGLKVARAVAVADDLSALFVAPADKGKTHLAVAVGWEHAARGRSVMFLEEPELRAAWSLSMAGRPDRLEELVREAVRVDTLVYDELGKFQLTDRADDDDLDGERASDFGGAVWRIANGRAKVGRPSIVTTQSMSWTALCARCGFSILRRFELTRRGKRSSLRAIWGGGADNATDLWQSPNN